MGWFAGIPVNVYVPRPTLRGRVPKPPSSYWFPSTFSTVTVTLEGRHCGAGAPPSERRRPVHAPKLLQAVPYAASNALLPAHAQRMMTRFASDSVSARLNMFVMINAAFDVSQELSCWLKLTAWLNMCTMSKTLETSHELISWLNAVL